MPLNRITFTLILLSLFACEKNDPIEMKDCFLVSETENQILKAAYEYENRKLVQYRAYNEIEALLHYSNYTYDAAGILSVIHTYSPQDDLLSIRNITYYGDSIQSDLYILSSLISYEMFYFNDTNCPLESVASFSPRGERGDYVLVEYDELCNPTLAYYGPSGNPTGQIIQATDGRNGAYQFVSTPLYESFNRHNLIGHIEYDSLGMTLPSFSYSASFVYNPFDYPTEEVRTYQDGRVVHKTFEYDCKKVN